MPLRTIATRIVKRLQESGHTAYFAGGWVRDYLLKVPSDDIDIATSASVSEVQALFPKTIPVGIAFGILIVVEEGHQFEVATFRKESDYKDGRRPTSIEEASAAEDAKRRDFTINGMFFDPIQDILLDFVGGVEDIQKKQIRAIGNPHDRFLEDRLRMMRAVRYAARFHFPIEPETEKAILLHATDLFPAVAIERVWQEFEKMASFSYFYKGLEKLYELKLLEAVFPSLQLVPAIEVKKRLAAFHSFPKATPLILELIHLFPEGSLEQHLDLCDYLKRSKKEQEQVRFFHQAKSLLDMPHKWQEDLDNLEWARFYAHPLSSICLSLFKAPMRFHEENKKKLFPYTLRIQSKKPLITSQDLIPLGISPGPALGLLLQEAEKISVNWLLEDKSTILEKLTKSPLWPMD